MIITILGLILTHLGAFAGGVLTMTRRRSRDIMLGYGAGVAATNLPPRVEVCACGHPLQEHRDAISPHVDVTCVGVTVIDVDSKAVRAPCDCTAFTFWHIDDAASVSSKRNEER